MISSSYDYSAKTQKPPSLVKTQINSQLNENLKSCILMPVPPKQLTSPTSPPIIANIMVDTGQIRYQKHPHYPLPWKVRLDREVKSMLKKKKSAKNKAPSEKRVVLRVAIPESVHESFLQATNAQRESPAEAVNRMVRGYVLRREPLVSSAVGRPRGSTSQAEPNAPILKERRGK
jgi:hypothetical protein